MLNETLQKERQALLALELTSLGVDVRRLGFLRWLHENAQDPEWCGESLAVESVADDLFFR
jgi:hypothetical protein